MRKINIDRKKYSNYGMIGAALLVITTFDTLSGYFFGSLGQLALLEAIMTVMLIAVLFMKMHNVILSVPYAFLAVTHFFQGSDYLTAAFDFALYFLMFLMCLLLLTEILPKKAKDAISKLWFLPASLWFAYNVVIMIVFIGSTGPVLFAANAFLTAVYAAAHLMIALWLKKPYKIN